MMKPCWVPPDAPFPSLAPGFPSYKTLTAPATCPSHSILTMTPTDEESKAQRAWEICLRSHSQKVAEQTQYAAWLTPTVAHVTSMWSAALIFWGVLALVCGQPHMTVTLLVP